MASARAVGWASDYKSTASVIATMEIQWNVRSVMTSGRSTPEDANSKFYPRSLTFLVLILSMVEEGLHQSDIARKLGTSKPHVHYYVEKAERFGYLRRVIRDAFVLLELTQPGKQFLDRYQKTVNRESLPICRAENIRFIADVLVMPSIPLDWKRVSTRNWRCFMGVVDNVRIKFNEGSQPSIEFILSPMDNEDPLQILVDYVDECIQIQRSLHEKLGIKTGRLRIEKGTEWLVYDPVAKLASKALGQVRLEGIGKLNASAPRHVGEFEFPDPRALMDYLLMPKRLHRIEKSLADIVQLAHSYSHHWHPLITRNN